MAYRVIAAIDRELVDEHVPTLRSPATLQRGPQLILKAPITTSTILLRYAPPTARDTRDVGIHLRLNPAPEALMLAQCILPMQLQLMMRLP